MIRTRYVYRITNLVNGKTYIGQHTVRKNRTVTSDTYWGSGKLIVYARRKYGKENFKKEILFVGDYTQDEINELEKLAISNERALGKAEYNIADGGSWGLNGHYYWDNASEEQKKKHSEHNRIAGKKGQEAIKKLPDDVKKAIQEKAERTRKERGFSHHTKGTTGMKFTEEQRKHVSEGHKGERNGSFGKHWYTNGKENILSENCPDGFHPGRV